MNSGQQPAGIDALQELGRLLGTADARPKINRARLAPSTLHDPSYHVAIVACALRSHGEGPTHRILAAWLKLLQFVAARPGLVGNLREYIRTRREHDLESWSRMPHGYLGDRTHESVIDLLVAAGFLRRSGDDLESGEKYGVLESLATRIEAEGLFAGERSVLAQLEDVRVTKALLGGVVIEIASIEIEGATSGGRFGGQLKLEPGLNVLSAENAYGKTLAMTAIPWCLGLEPMFGMQNNDPARFPPAVRDVVTFGNARDIEVASSAARITLRRHDGALLTLQRPIKGADPEIVEVREGTTSGVTRTSRLRARRETMADEVGGLQRFLFEWLALPRTPLMTLKGSRAELYLENIAPLFFVDQNEGWTDLQALQVYRYGLQEVGEAAVEYLLGARDALAARFRRQEQVSVDARLKGEAEKLVERVTEFFRRRGWTSKWSAFGSPAEIAKRWSSRTLTEYARDEFRMDVAQERTRLDARIVSLRNALASTPVGSVDLAPASQASQQVVELKTRRHQLRSELRDARMLLADHRALLATIEHRIHSSRDVLRLKTQGIGRLELVECPTCHRELDPTTFQLTEQSTESVAAHIDALGKQRAALVTNIAAAESEVTRLDHGLVVIEDTLLSAGRALETVNRAVGTTRESLAKVATDLAAAERELDALNAFAKELVELEVDVKRWLDEVRAATEGKADEGDLQGRLDTFAEKLRGRLLDLGHSAVSKGNAKLVHFEDRYVPYLGPRRLRSLGSASDHARLVAAYVLALADASRARSGPHPGFVILDEPLQQNPDPKHRELMIRFLEQTASGTTNQVIVTTSLRTDELAQLRKAGVRATALPGKHFLHLLPEKAAPK